MTIEKSCCHHKGCFNHLHGLLNYTYVIIVLHYRGLQDHSSWGQDKEVYAVCGDKTSTTILFNCSFMQELISLFLFEMK